MYRETDKTKFIQCSLGVCNKINIIFLTHTQQFSFFKDLLPYIRYHTAVSHLASAW